METRERDNSAKRPARGWPGVFWCGSEDEAGQMAGCCGGPWAMGDRGSMMDRCMRMCRWFPLVPLILGTALLLLGYYLDASLARVLWMFMAGFVALMGFLGLLLAGRMCRAR